MIKIFVDKPVGESMEFIEDSIKQFSNVAYMDRNSIFKLMEEKVPTYKRKK